MSPPEPGLGPPGDRVVFVYYRIHPSRAAALRQAFAGVVTSMAKWQPRLMRKVQSGGDGTAAATGQSGQLKASLQTWMEVYRPPDEVAQAGEAVQSQIDDCARAAGIFGLIEGERHYEIFEPCA
jgi:hypothetical protein